MRVKEKEEEHFEGENLMKSRIWNQESSLHLVWERQNVCFLHQLKWHQGDLLLDEIELNLYYLLLVEFVLWVGFELFVLLEFEVFDNNFDMHFDIAFDKDFDIDLQIVEHEGHKIELEEHNLHHKDLDHIPEKKKKEF